MPIYTTLSPYYSAVVLCCQSYPPGYINIPRSIKLKTIVVRMYVPVVPFAARPPPAADPLAVHAPGPLGPYGPMGLMGLMSALGPMAPWGPWNNYMRQGASGTTICAPRAHLANWNNNKRWNYYMPPQSPLWVIVKSTVTELVTLLRSWYPVGTKPWHMPVHDCKYFQWSALKYTSYIDIEQLLVLRMFLWYVWCKFIKCCVGSFPLVCSVAIRDPPKWVNSQNSSTYGINLKCNPRCEIYCHICIAHLSHMLDHIIFVFVSHVEWFRQMLVFRGFPTLQFLVLYRVVYCYTCTCNKQTSAWYIHTQRMKTQIKNTKNSGTLWNFNMQDRFYFLGLFSNIFVSQKGWPHNLPK